jgi:hypothetical protein
MNESGLLVIGLSPWLWLVALLMVGVVAWRLVKLL